MSTFGLPAQAIGGIAAVAGGIIDTILIRQGRNIAGIYPDVVVKEVHHDEMEITEHPIESGASISDHAFKRPAELLMQFGWSNSSSFLTLFTGGIDDIYRELLDLQRSREPFSIVTGKRSYENMLMRSLSVETDKSTEHVLMVEATFQQLIIVRTQTVILAVPLAQKMPQKTAPPVNTGSKQPKEVPESVIHAIVRAVTAP